MEIPIRKIAIIVGHGDGADKGATNHNGESEFEYQSKAAKLVERLMEGDHKLVECFYRSGLGISGVMEKACFWHPDMIIELHNNAFDGKAHGCECLALHGHPRSIEMAKLFAKEFTQRFGRKMRGSGCKELKQGDRGFFSLSLAKGIPYVILVEPFFGDNPSDWVSHIDYANFLADWLKKL